MQLGRHIGQHVSEGLRPRHGKRLWCGCDGTWVLGRPLRGDRLAPRLDHALRWSEWLVGLLLRRLLLHLGLGSDGASGGGPQRLSWRQVRPGLTLPNVPSFPALLGRLHETRGALIHICRPTCRTQRALRHGRVRDRRTWHWLLRDPHRRHGGRRLDKGWWGIAHLSVLVHVRKGRELAWRGRGAQAVRAGRHALGRGWTGRQ